MTRAPQFPQVTHEMGVIVVSPEEASDGVAEFWAGDSLFGFTYAGDGELLLRIEPSHDGSAVVVSTRCLAKALADANRRLTLL